MYRKVNLTGIVISEPKSVKKTTSKESIISVLPEYYQTIVDKKLAVRNNDGNCWFCKQSIGTIDPMFIETLYGDKVGYFCSRICRDSFANMIRSIVALREEPKISLLPLQLYENPEEVIALINNIKHKEGIYGGCLMESGHRVVRLTLRCHCNSN